MQRTGRQYLDLWRRIADLHERLSARAFCALRDRPEDLELLLRVLNPYA